MTGSLAMFPSPYFNAHFEVLHEKRVMEMPKKKIPSLTKKFLCSLEVVFDLCEKGLM